MAQLPCFLVIGAGKSGTTAIHEFLRQHHQISLPLRKETHFFINDKNSIPSPASYFGKVFENCIDNLEDYFADFEIKPDASVYGEVCPSYLFFPNAAENINKTIPDVKIICILRNPVDRFYSNINYHSNKNDDSDKKTKIDNSRLFDETVASITNHTNTVFTARCMENGFYYKQLTKYYAIFPSSNIKVFLYEDLQKQPLKLMNDLIGFIGLPEYNFDVEMKFNVSGKLRFKWLYRYLRRSRLASFFRKYFPTRTYQKIRNISEKIILGKADPISSKSRKILQNIYRQDILDLQNLINRDLSEWLV